MVTFFNYKNTCKDTNIGSMMIQNFLCFKTVLTEALRAKMFLEGIDTYNRHSPFLHFPYKKHTVQSKSGTRLTVIKLLSQVL